MSRLHTTRMILADRMIRNTFLWIGLISLAAISQSAFAVTFLSDDFTVTANSQDVNLDIAGGRQTGTKSPSNYTVGGAQHQVGNNETDTGQPGGVSNSDFLLLAFDSSVQNGLEINAALAGGAPITISFDMYVSGNPNGAPADDWGAFSLRGPGDGWPVAGAGEFGMLVRNSGGIQVFSNGAAIADQGAGYSTDPHWDLTFSDTAGTGSAFDGNGSLLTYTNGANSDSIALDQLNSTGLLLGFRNLGGMFIGVDNLLITGDPLAIPGDADHNGLIEAADFDAIRNNFYTSNFVVGQIGDSNLDGAVDEADYRDWRIAFDALPSISELATVPEPSSMILLVSLAYPLVLGNRRLRRTMA